MKHYLLIRVEDKCTDRHIHLTYECLLEGAVPVVTLFLKGKHEKKSRTQALFLPYPIFRPLYGPSHGK